MFSSGMANFPDPQVDIVTSAQQVHLTIVKLWHAVGGLYIWEYFTTLDYEWRVIQRRLPYRWTIWIRNDRTLHIGSTRGAASLC